MQAPPDACLGLFHADELTYGPATAFTGPFVTLVVGFKEWPLFLFSRVARWKAGVGVDPPLQAPSMSIPEPFQLVLAQT